MRDKKAKSDESGNLKKLGRAELLEMMIRFSQERDQAYADARQVKEDYAAQREQLLEQLSLEKAQLQEQMAQERAELLKSFDEEKAQMRAKFAEQKAEMQAKFDKDIIGLKSRHAREEASIRAEVYEQLKTIKASGNLAEAALGLNKIFEVAQQAADQYLQSIKESH